MTPLLLIVFGFFAINIMFYTLSAMQNSAFDAAAVLAAVQAAGPHFLIGRVEVSGPGYLNIFLAANYVAARLSFVLARGVRARPSPHEVWPSARSPEARPGLAGAARRVVVDYSSPNIAKEMHVGHLRSTIIGDTLARVLEFCGHEVLRVNHVGDWGTQFGMLIAHLKDLLASGAVRDADLDASIGDLSGFYKKAKARFDAEPDFKKRAHENVVALQAGDATNVAYWRRMVAVSEAMFKQVYARLSVDPRLELCGESMYPRQPYRIPHPLTLPLTYVNCNPHALTLTPHRLLQRQDPRRHRGAAGQAPAGRQRRRARHGRAGLRDAEQGDEAA